MLVYGDPSFGTTLRALAAAVRWTYARCGAGGLDQLRALLIQAGQVEQAVEDAQEDGRAAHFCREITNRVAEAFYTRWAEVSGKSSNSVGASGERWHEVGSLLDKLASCEEMGLTVKTPEGFEFYGLYPEQYAASAQKWAEEHREAKGEPVMVVGIRSIGTSLSAVVMSALQAAGYVVRRCTVRLSGHPYQRKLPELPRGIDPAGWAIVVDEGPGASGSSMAGTVEALIAAGLQPERITFFPGHSGEPGPAASSATREIWQKIARVHTPLEALRWEALSLREQLRVKLARVLGFTQPPSQVEDLSGGLWRKVVYQDDRDWPGVAAQFERMKYRVGWNGRGGYLLKFTGLGAFTGTDEAGNNFILSQLQSRARQGWCPEPVGTFCGFAAMPWVRGRRLTARDAESAEVLEGVARYIVDAAGPPLAAEAAIAGIARLQEMVNFNMTQTLGGAWQRRAFESASILEATRDNPSYGDGRMAPHEWVRDEEKLWKLDGVGHEIDHTLIGRQSVFWDIAGAITEWGMDARNRAIFLKTIEGKGIDVSLTALEFYRCAYVAFRLGYVSMAMGGAEPGEQARLRRDYEFYYTVGEGLAETPEP